MPHDDEPPPILLNLVLDLRLTVATLRDQMHRVIKQQDQITTILERVAVKSHEHEQRIDTLARTIDEIAESLPNIEDEIASHTVDIGRIKDRLAESSGT